MRLRMRSRGRLTAPGGANEGSGLVGVERQADALQRAALAIEEIEIANPHLFLQPQQCQSPREWRLEWRLTERSQLRSS